MSKNIMRTPEEKEKTLKEALENMNYRHDEDFY